MERFAFDRLLADVMESADVRVIEGGNALRLALETGPELFVAREVRRQKLDRHFAIEAGVLGAVDLAHAPFADGSDDFVRAKASGGREPGRRLLTVQGTSEDWDGRFGPEIQGIEAV